MMTRHYDSDQTRSVIAEKAAHLFAQKGFAGTSISDISRETGYSKGHVYYHFENKEKLFLYLAKDSMRAWAEKWEAISPKYETATDKLYAMATFVLNNYHTPLLKVGQELASNPNVQPETVQELYGLAATPMQAYAMILQLGIDTGEFTIADLEATTFLLGTWFGALCHHIYTMDYEQLHERFHQSVTIFLGGVRRQT